MLPGKGAIIHMQVIVLLWYSGGAFVTDLKANVHYVLHLQYIVRSLID